MISFIFLFCVVWQVFSSKYVCRMPIILIRLNIFKMCRDLNHIMISDNPFSPVFGITIENGKICLQQQQQNHRHFFTNENEMKTLPTWMECKILQLPMECIKEKSAYYNDIFIDGYSICLLSVKECSSYFRIIVSRKTERSFPFVYTHTHTQIFMQNSCLSVSMHSISNFIIS